jgi:guanylate kinase
MRPGDSEGVTYYFLDEQEFKRRIDSGSFLEWACVHGNYYGTLLEEVHRINAMGQAVILEIDVQGYELVRQKMPEAYGVFIAPPSLEVLEERLRGRASDSEESIQTRLANARVEMQAKDSYNAVIINDDLEDATRQMAAVVDRYLQERL